MQCDRVIKVRPDGSGIIEEPSLMRKEFFHQMQAMAGNIAKQAGEQKDVQDKPQTRDFFNEAKFKEAAKEFGEALFTFPALK